MENERRKNPRLLSLLSLKAMENAGKYANLEVSATLERGGLSEPDRGLYTALVYGVLERRLTLEYILQQLSKRSVKDLEPSVRLAACLGLYQLIYMDRIPEHAAVSESVSLVSGPGRGFVNAVLRSFLRGGKTWKEPDRNTDLLGF